MDEKKKGIIVIGAVVLFSGAVLAFMGGNNSGLPKLSRADVIKQCIDDPYDYVEKQSLAYCECFADNYPKLAKQVEKYKGKTVEQIVELQKLELASGKADVMAKCEPLRARDFNREAEVLKQQIITGCMSGNASEGQAYCECQGSEMAADYVKKQMAGQSATAERHVADSKEILGNFDRANDYQDKCEHLKTARNTARGSAGAPAPVVIPDHLDVIDEHGNKTVTLPVRIPPQ